MGQRWFTSDTHFGHLNIIRYCQRPYPDVAEMNAALIERWNAVVAPDDEVWHLGDVAMGKLEQTLPLVQQLNGHKRLIAGNHDRVSSLDSERTRTKFRPLYEEIGFRIEPEQVELHVGAHKVLLCHFPYEGDSHDEDRFAQKRPKDRGLPLLHGHVHTTWHFQDRQFNVGVDVNHYQPVPESRVHQWLTQLAAAAS